MNSESHGNRNLMILGSGALLIAFATTCLSLWIYRSTGDIYLDRSRPGYLPDEEEVGDEKAVNTNYTFNENQELTAENLDEYLTELEKLNQRLDALEDPYSAGPLSDESLGIPKPEKEKSKTDKTKK